MWQKKHVSVISPRAAQLSVRKGNIYDQPHEEKQIKEKKKK